MNSNQDQLVPVVFEVDLTNRPLNFHYFNGKGSSQDPTDHPMVLNGGKHILEFAETPQQEFWLSSQEMISQGIPLFVHPHHVFSSVSRITSLHRAGTPVAEFHIQVPEENNLITINRADSSDRPLEPGRFTLVRHPDFPHFLVVKEWLDDGPFGLPESRWLWLWSSNLWDSWQMGLLQVGQLSVIKGTSTATQTNEPEHKAPIVAVSG